MINVLFGVFCTLLKNHMPVDGFRYTMILKIGYLYCVKKL